MNLKRKFIFYLILSCCLFFVMAFPQKRAFALPQLVIPERYVPVNLFKADGLRNNHFGIDLKAAPDEEFYSPLQGKVKFVGYTPVSTETLTIETTEGYLITFLNLYRLQVKKGEFVNTGQLIGFVFPQVRIDEDRTHVHLSVRDQDGAYLDPLNFIVFVKEKLEAKNYFVTNQQSFELKYLNSEESLSLNISETKDTVNGFNLLSPVCSGLATGKEKNIRVDSSSKHLQKQPPGKSIPKTFVKKMIPPFKQQAKGLVKKKFLQKERLLNSDAGFKRTLQAPESGFAGNPPGPHFFHRKIQAEFPSLLLKAMQKLFLVLLLIIVVAIIWAQSLLPANAGGRLSPKGGVLVAGIRNNVHCSPPAHP